MSQIESCITHRIHGTGVFTYMQTIEINHHVGKYTSPMDPMSYFNSDSTCELNAPQN